MDAVRQLFRTCQPSSRNRSLGLPHVIMQWPSFDMKVHCFPRCSNLKIHSENMRRLHPLGSLPEEIRFAVLMKVLGGQLKTYLQVTLKDGTSYEDLRESALRYDQSTIRWRQSMKLGSSVAFQGTPQFLWMWTEWRKEKVRRARAKVALKARTKVKVTRKVRLLERKMQTVAKVMVIKFIILFGRLFIGLCTLVGVNSHSAWTVRPSLGAMAVDPDEADREYISQNMDADLQFILSESGKEIWVP